MNQTPKHVLKYISLQQNFAASTFQRKNKPKHPSSVPNTISPLPSALRCLVHVSRESHIALKGIMLMMNW